MADQEFLASFGVEVDEAGVTRLQKVQELYDSFDFKDDPDYDKEKNTNNGYQSIIMMTP